MLKIRSFIVSEDEAVWAHIASVAICANPQLYVSDFRSVSVEEMRRLEKSPTFDASGMFIAEMDGKPVGIVNAHVNKFREEKKGFIGWLGVLPEYRRQGVRKALAKKRLKV